MFKVFIYIYIYVYIYTNLVFYDEWSEKEFYADVLKKLYIQNILYLC